MGEGGTEKQKGYQFYWHFHFQCNLIPITSTRSGPNFCFYLTLASEGRVGGEKRERLAVRQERCPSCVQEPCWGNVNDVTAAYQRQRG